MFLLAPGRPPRLFVNLADNEISGYEQKEEFQSFLLQLTVLVRALLLSPAILPRSLGGRHPGLLKRTDSKKADPGLVQRGRWLPHTGLRQIHHQLDS